MLDLYKDPLNENDYDKLLSEKESRLSQLLAEFSPPELEVFASPKKHFRLRTEFNVWHIDDKTFYIMFKPGDRETKYQVTSFPIASKLINRLMTELLSEVHTHQILRRKLFQVDFLTTLSGDALITLIYHRPLDENWQEQAKQLEKKLGVAIIGRSRKQKILLSRDYVTEKLNVDSKTFSYRQIEGSFTQPNGEMNQKMLSWARKVSKNIGGDLVELYCGNGNFSIALADQFDYVLATEISKTSVHAAQENIRANQCDNLVIARLSAEEFVQALRGDREFFRLKDIDLTKYNFRTVLVDPPRSGLDDESVKQISHYEYIIYISCNPETLKKNMHHLSKTHNIEAFALFDQFPYTDHIETGLLLKRIKQ